jgi:hypothetical protein
MSKSRRILSAIALLTFFTVAAVRSSDAGGNTAFDGPWSVLIQTSQGKCGTYRAALEVASGQVLSRDGDYAVSGSVNANGVTAVTVINNNGSATGTGRLRGSSGSGLWRSSSGECSGTWTATRRQ